MILLGFMQEKIILSSCCQTLDLYILSPWVFVLVWFGLPELPEEPSAGSGSPHPGFISDFKETMLRFYC